MSARIGGLLALALLLLPASSRAQVGQCGPSCATRQITLCNDQLPLGTMTTADCSASIGSCDGEAFCASFGAGFPAGAFPLVLDNVYALVGPTAASETFDLEVYEERSPPTAQPGPQIGTTQSFAIGGNVNSLVQIAPVGIVINTPGPFRVCLRKQFDSSHNVCLDTTAAVASANWVEVQLLIPDPNDPFNPCGGTPLGPATWYEASQIPGNGLRHNFVLRAEVTPSDFEATPGTGACSPGGDAGPIGDGGTADVGVDGSAPDAGLGDADASDAAPDGGTDTGDASAGPSDGGSGDPDGGSPGSDVGPSPGGPPVITALSPRSGSSEVATALTITGRDFVSGLTVRIGSTAATNVSVSGGTTIAAVVPAGLAVAVYDVIVTNPDGQSAILEASFTVSGSGDSGSGGGSASPSAEGCRCARSTPPDGFMGLLGLGALLLCRRRRCAER
jgi:hypothetical protein